MCLLFLRSGVVVTAGGLAFWGRIGGHDGVWKVGAVGWCELVVGRRQEQWGSVGFVLNFGGCLDGWLWINHDGANTDRRLDEEVDLKSEGSMN